jgi:glucose/arabinose dehydrogenase
MIQPLSIRSRPVASRLLPRVVPALLPALVLGGCSYTADHAPAPSPESTIGANPTLPAPKGGSIPTVQVAEAEGWPDGLAPVPAAGLAVGPFATGLDHPRWLYRLPNGDVLVAESNAPPKPEGSGGGGLRGKVMQAVMKTAGAGVPSPDRITLLRDADGDGIAEVRSVFLQSLHSPFGMALVGSTFYVANADGIVAYPYVEGETQISGEGTPVTDLPGGLNHHWTKNILASPDGRFLYATVGSNSNVGENGLDIEEGRAAIWQVDLESKTKQLFATGLRNPNGLAWEPTTGELWTVVNERDELGNDLVPDYLTSVKDGAFYGWPYSYYGQNVDTRVEPAQPALVAKAVAPDYALGAHVAALGLAATTQTSLGNAFQQGMFIGEHGSWNRKPLVGYKVVFLPFQDGRPVGQPVDVLTGFVGEDGDAYGRPVGVTQDAGGALLVADDVGNAVWRVTAAR